MTSRYTTRQFNAAITALVEKAYLVPPELQSLARDELEDLVGRITAAAGFLMRPQDLPDDAHWDMPEEEQEGALAAFLANLDRPQRRRLKAIAEGLVAECAERLVPVLRIFDAPRGRPPTPLRGNDRRPSGKS
jgi:hypothetical protein